MYVCVDKCVSALKLYIYIYIYIYGFIYTHRMAIG